MDETGTLGVRVREEPRLVADRKNEVHTVMVAGHPCSVRVKTSQTDGRIIAIKPEYEDMKQIALRLDSSVSGMWHGKYTWSCRISTKRQVAGYPRLTRY